MADIEELYTIRAFSSRGKEYHGLVKWFRFSAEEVTLNENMILAEIIFYEKESKDTLVTTKRILTCKITHIVTPYSLNASMNWDFEFFKKLKLAFLTSPKDVKFTIEEERVVKEQHNIEDYNRGIKRSDSDFFIEGEEDQKKIIFRMDMLASSSFKINWIKAEMSIKIQTIHKYLETNLIHSIAFYNEKIQNFQKRQ